MAATSTGNAQWGVKFSVSGITGVMTDCDKGGEPIYAQQENELGAVIQTVLYDEHSIINCTLEVAAGVDLGTFPKQITVAGVQGMLTSAHLVESNKAFRKYNATVEAWKNCRQMTTAS